MERIKSTCYSTSSFIGRSYFELNDYYKGGIADKTEDHIERIHQVGKRFDQRYKCVTDFTQSQTSQIKLQDLLSNPIVEMKSEEMKIETSRKFKLKR